MKNRFRNNGNSSNIYIIGYMKTTPALRAPLQDWEITNRIKFSQYYINHIVFSLSTFNFQLSTFHFQLFTFSFQLSTFNFPTFSFSLRTVTSLSHF